MGFFDVLDPEPVEMPPLWMALAVVLWLLLKVAAVWLWRNTRVLRLVLLILLAVAFALCTGWVVSGLCMRNTSTLELQI